MDKYIVIFCMACCAFCSVGYAVQQWKMKKIRDVLMKLLDGYSYMKRFSEVLDSVEKELDMISEVIADERPK